MPLSADFMIFILFHTWSMHVYMFICVHMCVRTYVWKEDRDACQPLPFYPLRQGACIQPGAF